jgi:hypothetical protein
MTSDAVLAVIVWATFLAVLGSASIARAVRAVRVRLRWRKAVRTAKTFWADADDATLNPSDRERTMP